MTPNSDAIRAQLERLATSSAFANSHRLNRFLRFVVERTLAGESDRLKEYLIGVEVFDRDQQYDPRIDSIVRVEAGRLRSKLDEYYRAGGHLDPVVISLQRGSYAPVFAARANAAAPADAGPGEIVAVLPARPPQRVLLGALAFLLFALVSLWFVRQSPGPETTIAVLPFTVYSTDGDYTLLATQLTNGVSAELVMEGTLGVASSASARELTGTGRTMGEIAAILGTDVLLQGGVRVDGNQVRVETVLLLGDSKAAVEGFTGDVAALDELERRIALATAVAASGIER